MDRARCIGLGICESLAPDTFEVDDDGALVLLSDLADDDDDAVAEAVRGCPATALTITTEEEHP